MQFRRHHQHQHLLLVLFLFLATLFASVLALQGSSGAHGRHAHELHDSNSASDTHRRHLHSILGKHASLHKKRDIERPAHIEAAGRTEEPGYVEQQPPRQEEHVETIGSALTRRVDELGRLVEGLTRRLARRGGYAVDGLDVADEGGVVQERELGSEHGDGDGSNGNSNGDADDGVGGASGDEGGGGDAATQKRTMLDDEARDHYTSESMTPRSEPDSYEPAAEAIQDGFADIPNMQRRKDIFDPDAASPLDLDAGHKRDATELGEAVPGADMEQAEADRVEALEKRHQIEPEPEEGR
jgi:hypothetical protein